MERATYLPTYYIAIFSVILIVVIFSIIILMSCYKKNNKDTEDKRKEG